MKKLMIMAAAVLMCTAAGAQRDAQKYFVKTKNVQAEEKAVASDSTAIEPETSHSVMNDLFPRLSLCEWTDTMAFMVIPDKQDLVVPVFYDGYTNNRVSTMKLKHKIFKYDGHTEGQGGRRDIIKFVTDDAEHHPYYFEVPSGTFDDYCYLKLGVPALAYLNDVETAQNSLVGKTLITKSPSYWQDANYGDGASEAEVPLESEVRVTKVGVGTRQFPVKIVFEDKEGNEYFQYVAISHTNSGLRDEEFDLRDNIHHSFESAFDMMGDYALPSWAYSKYVGKKVFLRHATAMKDVRGDTYRANALASFKILDIRSQRGKGSVILTLQSSSNGTKYTKEVFFKNSPGAALIIGERENIYESLFGEGSPSDLNGVSQAHLAAIKQGKIQRGFTEEEVRLVRPDDYEVMSRTNNSYTWLFSALSGKSEMRVTFNKKTRKVISFFESK